jgi:hypothetical protein
MAAAKLRTLSSMPTPAGAGRAGAEAWGRIAVGAAEAADAVDLMPAAAEGGGTGIGAAPDPAGAGAGVCDVGGADGGVGSLIVGAALCLGGRLIRTVSFLGWTLAASAGLGGTAPVATGTFTAGLGTLGTTGVLGVFSDIKS